MMVPTDLETSESVLVLISAGNYSALIHCQRVCDIDEWFDAST